ncbi:MAG: DUF4133 domain-containing protein [Bacteroidota bacterium]
MSIVYAINRSIGKPIVFKGLKAQYIWWLGIGIAVLLLLFAMLYLMGAALLFCTGVFVIGGAALFYGVYKMNNRYGEHGWMKEMAARATPKRIVCDQLFNS